MINFNCAKKKYGKVANETLSLLLTKLVKSSLLNCTMNNLRYTETITSSKLEHLKVPKMFPPVLKISMMPSKKGTLMFLKFKLNSQMIFFLRSFHTCKKYRYE